jgi:hypothetical protein
MNQRILFRFLVLGVILQIFTSCRKAASEIPFYLNCDSAIISPSALGIANSGIYGLYVTVDADVRGTWQMPFKMPILNEGIKSVYIEPIVKENNLSTRFFTYPLYSPKIVDINMIKGKSLDTIFSFDYVQGVNLIANEDMEVNTNFPPFQKSNLARNGSGSMELVATNTTADSGAITAFYYKQLPFNLEKTTFLEFDYYMPAGVLAPALAYIDGSGNTKLAYGESFLNKNTGWTHVYFNYSFIINKIGKTGLYTPVFILITTNGVNSASAYIDNLRILEK